MGKSFLFYAISVVLGKVLATFIVPLLFANALSQDDYGNIELLISVLPLLSAFTMLQLESALARFYYASSSAQDKQTLISTGFWTITFLSVLVIIIIISCSVFLIDYRANPKLLPSIIIAAITLPILNLLNYTNVIVRFENKPIKFLIITIIQLIGVACLLPFFLKNPDFKYYGILICLFAQNFIGLLCTILFLRKFIVLRFDWTVFKMMFTFSFPLIPTVLITWVNTYFNRFIVKQYSGAAELGIFAFTMRIAALFSLIDVAFSMSWAPFFWKNINSNTKYKEVFNKVFNLTAVSILFITIFIALLGKYIVAFLSTDNKYIQSQYYLGIACLIQGINIITQMVGMGPSIVKKTKYNFYVFLMSGLANVLTMYLFVRFWGVTGILTASLINAILVQAILWIISERLYPLGYNKKFYLLYLLLSTVIVLSISYFEVGIFIRGFLLLVAFFVFCFILNKNFNIRNIFKVRKLWA